MASYILFLLSSVIVHASIRMSIHKSLMLSHFNWSIMTTSTCKNQEGYNEVGEISQVIGEEYGEVVANVPDVFIRHQHFYPLLVEVSGMCRTYWEKYKYINILSIDKRGSWPHFCFWTQGASRGLVFQFLNISGTFMQTPSVIKVLSWNASTNGNNNWMVFTVTQSAFYNVPVCQFSLCSLRGGGPVDVWLNA